MIIGTWWSDSNIELVKINGKIYALDGWNGEKYLHCWECIDRFTAADSNTEYEIRPIYNSDGSFDFEVIWKMEDKNESKYKSALYTY